MYYQIPPAGNAVVLTKSEYSNEELETLLQAPMIRLYSSGTSALAAAIKAIIATKNIETPEVMLPAYSCPELVSAILFAGAKPVLVDLESKRPWLNLSELESRFTDNTVAIIAVNLFGIPERFAELKDFIRNNGIALIEDSAQYFPASEKDIHWQGDLTILSFGRGKPVSLLGGGAVLCSNREFFQHLPDSESASGKTEPTTELKFRLKAVAYNLLLSPRLYWLPQSLPFLHLGETIYHPMDAIEAFPAERLAYLPANIKAYWQRQHGSRIALDRMIPQFVSNDLIDLPVRCCGKELPPLIRYPVLAADKEQADKLYAQSQRIGLGISRMYQKPLNEIEGLQNLFTGQGPFPAAREFADLLLTLPTHYGVPANYQEYFAEK